MISRLCGLFSRVTLSAGFAARRGSGPLNPLLLFANFSAFGWQVLGVDGNLFERLFEDSFDSLYSYLARRVGPELARDLAAEAFAQAFAGMRRFDPERGDARGWLFGIAQNLLRRHYRDEERRLRLLARLDPPAHLSTDREESSIASALASLSVEERDVLLLFAWADLSYQEIATALRVPVGTVRSRLHSARARMRNALTEEEVLDG